MLVEPTPQSSIWAALIFILASLTDWLDGYLARLYHAESILGTLLDPLADKILVMAALVMLSASPIEPRVPAWLVVLLLAREILVSGLRSLAAIQGRTVVSASASAKHKTFWMMLALIFLLVRGPYELLAVKIDFFQIGMLLLWLSLVLSLYSGIEYAVRLRKLFVLEFEDEKNQH